MRVAGRPGVVAEGAVRPAGHLVEQRQVARCRRLVHDYGIDSSGNILTVLLFNAVLRHAVKRMWRMMNLLGGLSDFDSKVKEPSQG